MGFVTIKQVFYKILSDVEQIFAKKCKSNLTFSIGHGAPCPPESSQTDICQGKWKQRHLDTGSTGLVVGLGDSPT